MPQWIIELEAPVDVKALLRDESDEAVLAQAQHYGIAVERYEDYARRRWGVGWKVNPRGRRRVWDELERYRNDPAGYVDKVEAELHQAG